MSTRDVKKHCDLDEDSRSIMISAAKTTNLSDRIYFKVIKIARTMADLAGEEKILNTHIAGAPQYRPKIQE